MAARGRVLSSICTSPDSITPSWMPRSTAKSFAIHQAVVVPLLLSSLVMASRLSKPNACPMNSAQSATGSLWSSKMVPVDDVNVLPQAPHPWRWTPSASRPHRQTRSSPHLGQRSRTCLSRKEASPVSERVRCLNSYTLLWLSLTATCDGVRSASQVPSQGVGEAEGACHLLPLMLGSPCCLGGWLCHLTIIEDGLC